MPKCDHLEVSGVITKKLPGTKFEVSVKNERGEAIKLIATPCGRIRQFHIKLQVKDEVTVELSPYDITKGIIIWRK